MPRARDTAPPRADTPSDDIDTTETEEVLRSLKAASQVMSSVRFDPDARISDVHELMGLVADLVDEGTAEMERLYDAYLKSPACGRVSWAKEGAAS